MTRNNEIILMKLHESCKSICRLDKIICNNKQKWNKDKCRCDCKKIIDKGVCNKGYAWNLSNCECKCYKVCDVGEHLDYKNCKCTKKLTDKLIDDCTETTEQTKLLNITFNENENDYKCGSCIVYIVLMIVVFTISTGITVYLVYYN